MAQKTENEETEFKVPETLALCVNNCGVIGNPATNNMCQTCFNATTSASSSLPSAAVSSASLSGPIPKKPVRSTPVRSPDRSGSSSEKTTYRGGVLESVKKVVNRCSCCGRKVGLTGFRCRCGELFCGEHRYSDRHHCSYDYKTAGREAIARENPVVKAAKIVRV